MSRTLRRKVYFFRIADYGEMRPLLEGCVEAIDQLPFNDQGRYLATESDDVILALFVTSAKFPIKLQFGKIRRSALPMVEDAGKISPLKIAQRAGIIDWSHIVIFEDGTVAAEFNQDAPRIARLGEYLSLKARGALPNAPKFYPLFQRAIMEELEGFEAVTMLEIEASTLDADLIAEVDKSLGGAFKACRSAGEVSKARLVLKAEKKLTTRLKGLARKLVSNAESREALTFLRATGKTIKGSKPLNRLEEYLVSTEEFIRIDSRTRALNPAHAFAVIEDAYEAKKARLNDAAQAYMPW